MPSERDKTRGWLPWWLRQPEVCLGGGGFLLFLLLSLALLIYNFTG